MRKSFMLAIRTDSPVATLVLLDHNRLLDAGSWEAGRRLASQLIGRIESLLLKNKLEWSALTGLIVYAGPGSFTGLRIGATVANTLAYSQNIPIVGVTGADWINTGIIRLKDRPVGQFVVPQYGAEPNITMPKK